MRARCDLLPLFRHSSNVRTAVAGSGGGRRAVGLPARYLELGGGGEQGRVGVLAVNEVEAPGSMGQPGSIAARLRPRAAHAQQPTLLRSLLLCFCV